MKKSILVVLLVLALSGLCLRADTWEISSYRVSVWIPDNWNVTEHPGGGLHADSGAGDILTITRVSNLASINMVQANDLAVRYFAGIESSYANFKYTVLITKTTINGYKSFVCEGQGMFNGTLTTAGVVIMETPSGVLQVGTTRFSRNNSNPHKQIIESIRAY